MHEAIVEVHVDCCWRPSGSNAAAGEGVARPPPRPGGDSGAAAAAAREGTASPRPGGSSAGAAREGAAGHSRGGNKWRPDITIGGTVLPWTDRFKYLGSHFTATGELDTELSYCIGCAAAVFRRLQRPFFCQRAIFLGTRMVVFVVTVLSVLL